ncbi:LysR family transcriptional regulator [Alteromonas gilva]|uniref:LysR family transcriptional regulator n=1 Tax=Alteromonas gilva TaxID=2987522 RepID=A0ABT5L295_9ALTE|nr:LysR family transcriptional regulator [Alteromonas gilva]MDC8830998.1 LysR family transcriptional regulator [Alteromonas gilva]
MQVSLPALKAFESAARLGSFKAAAAELAISPTAVSHHINKLEQRLSVRLFERSARKVTLTAQGKELATAASEGFNVIQQALNNLTVTNQHINVATTSSFAALVLLPALNEFYAKYPQCSVNITSGEQIEPDNFTLPIRLGDVNQQVSSDIIKREQFNLFSAAYSAEMFNRAEQVTVYTNKWKNPTLPAVPIEAWLALNGLSSNKLDIRYFDQELFCIQQALQENACVFCSGTLVQGYLSAGLLSELNTRAVDSLLCYYLADKEKRTSRHNVMFIEWLEALVR